jgi:hypothetical protein
MKSITSYMRKTMGIVFFCLFAVPLVSLLAYADQNNQLVIINHYDKPLDFLISVNPDVIPDLPTTFTLDVNATASSKVVDLQKSTYVLAQDKTDDKEKLGFWGVSVEDGKTRISGYTSHGIAFSMKGDTITFCKPEDYDNKHLECVVNK